MGLIRFALRHPVTISVLVCTLLGAGVLALARMPIDIFPTLDVPVIYVVQPFGGMAPAEMEGYIVNYYEANFLFISGVEHEESRAVQNFSLIKLTFHPGTDMSQAAAETGAYIARALAYMPTGTVPPFVMRYDAGSIPVGDVILSSPQRAQHELDDFAQTRVRPLFSSIAGVSAPPPIGGNPRSVVVNLDPQRLASYRLAPDDVVRAITQSNVVLPSGNVRIGDAMTVVHLNSVVPAYRDLLAIPVMAAAPSRGPVLLRDLATVEDQADVVSGYAELDGRRVIYIPVTKHAGASTVRVVNAVRAALPLMRQQVPADVKVEFAFDQSVFVREALRSLVIEGLLGAGLTALLIWAFLREGRSALIVVITIPTSLLAAIAGLWLCGQSLNLMTVGGLALATGILVDEATVSVENIHLHLGRGGPAGLAVLNASTEILGPKVLAMLAVVTVFLPALLMTGISRSLFVPLSLAVALAMAASLGLSLTLLPVLAERWNRNTASGLHAAGSGHGWLRFRSAVAGAAAAVAGRRWAAPGYLAVALGLAFLAGNTIGTDIFPQSTAGQFQMRVRAPAGTRLERSEDRYRQALKLVQAAAGADNVATTLGFVGTQPRAYPVNNIYVWTSGSHEMVLQVVLRDHAPVGLAELRERLRADFAKAMPDATISFEAGDIVGQVLNLGSATPIAVEIAGLDIEADHTYAERVRQALARIPELRDLQYGQSFDTPAVLVDVDRQRAADAGVTINQIGRTLTEATASSRFIARDFWQDPNTGLTYQVQILLPPSSLASLGEVQSIPVAQSADYPGAPGGPSAKPVLMGDIAEVHEGTVRGELDHDNDMRMISLTANFEHSSLGEAARAVERVVATLPAPPRGTRVSLTGQVPPMRSTLAGLQTGLGLAIVLILLMLTAAYESWQLAVAALSPAPGVIVGALAMLHGFGSTLNIQSYLGMTMAIGISVANSILLVTFAEQERRGLLGESSTREARPAAALAAARSAVERRLRPILMTAAAMIAGMVPMALAWESGGAQSAPLGQAVIGGLVASTFVTVLVTPAVFTRLRLHATGRKTDVV
ncbi:MAG TPA: efflux RND transporter permease subunit [Terriglobales bacterium]|nr:efflux RND transporter permease subunit [Terriglobales bacterium]